MNAPNAHLFGVSDIDQILRGRQIPTRSPAELPGGKNADGGQWPALCKEEIRRELRDQLLFEPSKNAQKVLRAYDRAAAELSELKAETEEFVGRMIEASFDLSQFRGSPNVSAQVEREMRRLLADVLKFHFTDFRSVKTLEMLAGDAADMFSQLISHLSLCIDAFVDELFRLLALMRSRHVVGAIQYSGRRNEFCEFSYFRSKAVPNHEGRTRSKRAQQVTEGAPYMTKDGWRKKRRTKTHLVVREKATIQHVRARQLLSNVTTIPLDSWKLPLPPRILPVERSLPKFFRPWASVVHGTLEHARFVGADVSEVAYKYTAIETRDEEVRHDDPCLLLGPYVITGWCPAEQPSSSRTQRLFASVQHRLAARKAGN